MRQALEVQVQSESLGLHPRWNPITLWDHILLEGPHPQTPGLPLCHSTLCQGKGNPSQWSLEKHGHPPGGLEEGEEDLPWGRSMPPDPRPRPQPSPWTAATPFP